MAKYRKARTQLHNIRLRLKSLDFQSALSKLKRTAQSQALGKSAQQRQKLLRKQLKHRQAASKVAWKDLQHGLKLAWNDLSYAVKRAASRFK